MNNELGIAEVRKNWAQLKKKLAKQLIDSGFIKKGDGFWKETANGDAFAGVTFGATVGRAKTAQIDFSFRMLGGRKEFHSLAGQRFGESYRPSIEAAQFSAYIVDGQKGKRWTLQSSTSLDEIYSEVSKRLANDAFPKIEAMLDRKRLLNALKTFDVNIADGAMGYDDAIRLLAAKEEKKERESKVPGSN